jgi:hypothetical protein
MMNKTQSTTNIIISLRGLMVLRYDEKREIYEVGVVPADGHVFRINEIQMGRVERDLKEEGETLLRFENQDLFTGRILHIDSVAPTARVVEPPPIGLLDRQERNQDESDFRWIIDLEGEEFYNHELPLKPGLFMPILHITSGRLLTRVLPPESLLRRQGDGQLLEFGRVAADTAIEIQGEAILRNNATKKEIFRFKSNPGFVYRILNTPISSSANPEDFEPPSAHGQHSPSDHFQYYYNAFPIERDKRFEFSLPKSSSAPSTKPMGKPKQPHFIPPGPEPARCGAVYLSKRTTSLE